MMDNGFEINQDYIDKLLNDEVYAKGPSLFDKEIFSDIKENIILGEKRVSNDAAATTPVFKAPYRIGIDVNKELKRFSSIEN